MTHTPTPWISDNSHKADRVGVQIWADDVIIADVVPDQHDNEIANAAFIVEAVNSHDALVKALKGCLIALRTHSPNVPEDERGWTSYDEEAVEAGYEALALAQEVRT